MHLVINFCLSWIELGSFTLRKYIERYCIISFFFYFQFSSVQSLSHAWLFVTPWTAACQASLSITNSRSLPKPMSIESVMPSNPLILSCPLLLPPSIFPGIRVFSNQVFASGGQSIWVSASTSLLPMITQDWSPLGWTDWISLQSKGLSRVFSNTTVQKHQFFGAQVSLGKNIYNTKFIILIILSVQFSSGEHIHTVVKQMSRTPSPLFFLSF